MVLEHFDTFREAIELVEYKFYGVISNQDYNEAKEIVDIITSHQDEKTKILNLYYKDITLGNNAAIRIATREGLLRTIVYLIDRGADPTVDEHYCMKWAIRMGYIHIVKYLVRVGERVDENCIVDSIVYGRTSTLVYLIGILPIHACNVENIFTATIQTSRAIETLEIILEQDLDTDKINSILEIALRYGSIVIVSYLYTRFEKINIIETLFYISDGAVWNFIDSYMGEWIDNFDFLHYILVQDTLKLIGDKTLKNILETLFDLKWNLPLDTVLLIMDRIDIGYEEIFQMGHYDTVVEYVVPYITGTLILRRLLPPGVDNITKRIHRLEDNAAKTIQRTWKRYSDHKEPLWERIYRGLT